MPRQSGGNEGAPESGARSSVLSVTVVMIIVLVFLIVAVILYVAWYVWRRDLRSTTLIKTPMSLFGEKLKVIDGKAIPATTNGLQYAVSTWVYLLDYAPLENGRHRHILSRNTSAGSLPGATFVIFMDGKTNAMYVSLKTNQAKAGVPVSLNDLVPSSTTADAVTKLGYLTYTIDYVPMQRWVNVTVSVQDRTATVYLDGDIFGVMSATDDANRVNDVRPLFANSAGSIAPGFLDAAPEKTHGFLGATVFYNYSLTQGDARLQYVRGPTTWQHGWWNYGWRNPIYKLDEYGGDPDRNRSVVSDSTPTCASCPGPQS